MKKYLSLGKISMQNAIAHRSAFIINMTASLIFAAAMFYLWRAIYAGRSNVAGYSWDELKAYLLIAFISNTLLSWYSETRIAGMILDGSVAMDLLKPLDFQKARLAETLGTSIFEGGVSVVMMSIVLVLFAGIRLPASAGASALFVVSMVASLVIKFSVVYLAGLVCFWTSNSLGIVWARAALTSLFSGALVPLPFFPSWLEAIALALPFQGIVHTPASIYLGRATGTDALSLLALQLFWCVALWFAGKGMWRWAVRQVTIHGG